jgi:hypothetical protein
MPQVLLTGWNPGLRKVPLTKLIQSRASVSLKAAISQTERLLDGKPVTIDLPTIAEARDFVLQARALGAVAEVDARPKTTSSTSS